MKRVLAAALSACLLMLSAAFAAPAAASDQLPDTFQALSGLDGYKAYVYQDFSAENLSMWVNNAGNAYSIAEGKLSVTNWAAWTQGKVEQAGKSINAEEINAAEGYGFYIKQTQSQWIRPLYYIQSSNSIVTPPGETEYILIPADGGEPVEGAMRASGDFLLSGEFEGYVLIKLPLSGLAGFSPYAAIGGNLNVSQDAPVYFDNFLLWAAAPAVTATATATTTATTTATDTATTTATATAATGTATADIATTAAPAQTDAPQTASSSAEPTPDLSDMVKLSGLKGYRAFVYEDFTNSELTIWQSDDYNQYKVAGGQLSVSRASGGAWTQAKIEQQGKQISQDVYNAAEGYGFYIKNNGSGQWIRPYTYISQSNKVVTPAGESEYILVPADGGEPVKGVMRASGDFLLPEKFEGYVLIPTPLKEMEGFSPYAFIGGNLRADGEYGTVYFDNFMVWMQDTDGSGSSGDLSVVLLLSAGIFLLLGAAAMRCIKRRAHR